MKDYKRYSYWLETCGDDLTPRPPLPGTVDVDVAILGAGFSGLWTAYYLLKRDPSLKVAILEKEIAGFGASGRNGGWCSAAYPLGLERLAEKIGREGAIHVHRAMSDTVDEVGRVAAAEGFGIDYAKGGSLWVARTAHYLPWVQDALKMYQEFGLGDEVEYLDAAATAKRVAIAGATGALHARDTALVHPAKLARGLARTVERMGATIYEQTAVTGYTTGAYPALQTERGHARARTIVLCGEAYLSQLPRLRRRIMPVYSLITLTEPLSASQWEQIGWAERAGISSARYLIDYLAKTADGRILFGGRGAPYHYGSSIRDEYDLHAPTHQMLQDNVRTWFPVLKDVRFTHSWGGPLGWPRDYVPSIAYDPAEGVATARGYTSVGVATSNLAGRILTDLITRTDSEVARLPIVGLKSKSWEPEPLRFLGVRYVQRAMKTLDEKADRTGKTPSGKSWAERLISH